MFGAAKLRLSGCVAGIPQGWGSMTLINQQGFDQFCLQLLTSLDGRGFFVINGVSWIIFDALVQIGICLM